MDGPTDGRTDIPSYRDARTHLKKCLFFFALLSVFLIASSEVLSKFVESARVSAIFHFLVSCKYNIQYDFSQMTRKVVTVHEDGRR